MRHHGKPRTLRRVFRRTRLAEISAAVVAAGAVLLAAAPDALADDATLTIGDVPARPASASHPGAGPDPDPDPDPALTARPVSDPDRFMAQTPELPRSPIRLTLGPSAITSGKGVGMGVGIGADFGTGSIGGRLAAAWLHGEGKTDGASTPTGDAVGQYTAEITLDLHKRGPVHPVLGMGTGFVHVSRPDGKSGFGGVGTGRVALEYALGLEDTDVRVGASVTGGVIGPVDDEVKDLRAYALAGVHLAIGF
jgi:hypothetical protein